MNVLDAVEMIKIGPAGEQLPRDAAEWSAVLLPLYGLMFTRSLINARPQSQTKLEATVKEVDCAGFTDWDLPELKELELVIDRTREGPALNTDFFTGFTSGWLWTKTAAAWSSSAAWLVFASYGYVGYGDRSYSGFALAVRRVGQ